MDTVDTLIVSLPLPEAERATFIALADQVFEKIIGRIEPENEEMTRALWDPAHYIDHHLLKPDMLPISRDYALSLIEAFLVHHVISLAVVADDLRKPVFLQRSDVPVNHSQAPLETTSAIGGRGRWAFNSKFPARSGTNLQGMPANFRSLQKQSRTRSKPTHHPMAGRGKKEPGLIIKGCGHIYQP